MIKSASLGLHQLTVAALMTILSPQLMAEEETGAISSFMDAVKSGKSMSSLRMRYEDVSQDGLQPGVLPNGHPNPTAGQGLKQADALTVRSLIGWQTAPYQNWSFAAQLINVSKLDDHFNDSTNAALINSFSNQPDRIAYAKAIDPDYTGVNQLFADWTGLNNTKLRAGRQQVILDNARFLGDVGFRQVMQVFDGVTLTNKSITNTELFWGHYEGVQQINTQYHSAGALDAFNLRYHLSPTESLIGYAYLDGFKDLGMGSGFFGNGSTAAAVAAGKGGSTNLGANQANKIIGLRLDGMHPMYSDQRLLYTAEYAKQTAYNGGDGRIDAYYYKVGAGWGIGNFTIRLDQEMLSSNHGKYAFQTPLGTNHLFQGWVDKFLITPLEGMKDSFVSTSYRFSDFVFLLDYHVFDADKNFYTVGSASQANGNRYGTEWDAAVTWTITKQWMTKFEYGQFREGDHYALIANVPNTTSGNAGRFRNTDKLWLTAMYSF